MADASTIDPAALARELAGAFATGTPVEVPSARVPGFDVAAAYAVEGELARMRGAAGHKGVGWKIGYANKAMWRALKLDTLVWAHMYDDTVQYASKGKAVLSMKGRWSPKIEPEIIFKMKAPVASSDAADVLAAVEWLALGFEIIDCVYPDWKFQPPDFIAAYGLHSGLVVGEPRRIDPAAIPALVDQLATFTVKLSKNGEVVDEGAGKSLLGSPALCTGELASAMARAGKALQAGELVSSGALVSSRPIAAGETWRAAVTGLDGVAEASVVVAD
jgi:2-oxo-3-hexenedioate decarboxylase